MKAKRTLTIATVFVALAAILTLGASRATRQVQAQDQEPPPVHDRISFGMVGITEGQTIRLNVVNTLPPGPILPPGPTRVVLTFLDANGHRLRNRAGQVIRRAMDLEPGQAAFLDLNHDELPPGPSRLQLRAVVNVIPPPVSDVPPPTNDQPPPINDRIVTSVEVFNNANGRTVLFMGNPGVIRGFNPQPDPPRE